MQQNVTDHQGPVAAMSEGRVFLMNEYQADIPDFDVARDRMDLGTHSVHSFIIVDTAAGAGFRNPWNGATQYLLGVRVADLNTANFLFIDNAHLREDVSGALAWEKGISSAANTVYMRTHEVGQIDRVDFDPATDKVSFLYASSREQYSLKDTSEGVEIANGGTGQKLILKGVSKAQLSEANFEFHFSQVREDHLDNQIGFSVSGSQIVPRTNIPTAGTDEGANVPDYLIGTPDDNIIRMSDNGGQAFGLAGDDTITGGSGEDTIRGQGGRDRLKGAAGDDVLIGGKAADILRGGSGKDKLFGGDGIDKLNGGAGNDKLRGGNGADEFVFSKGRDVVRDFDEVDTVNLRAVASITGFADLKNNHTQDVGGNLVIDDGAGNTLTLLNVSETSLQASDFIF